MLTDANVMICEEALKLTKERLGSSPYDIRMTCNEALDIISNRAKLA